MAVNIWLAVKSSGHMPGTTHLSSSPALFGQEGQDVSLLSESCDLCVHHRRNA